MKLTRHLKFLALLTSLTSLAMISAANAQIIGINFQGNDPDPLAPTDLTGVVSADNWNNLTAPNGTAPTLVDSTGTDTSLGLSYTSNGNVGSTSGGATPFDNLYDSHLESPYGNADTEPFSTPIGQNNRVTVSLTNIPYATYDLYVYVGGNAGSIYQATSTSAILNTATILSYTNANPGSSIFVAGDNYVEFTGLTGSSQYLAVSAPSSTDFPGLNSGISGIQIVDAVSTPEPSTYALLLMGMGLLVGFYRRSSSVTI